MSTTEYKKTGGSLAQLLQAASRVTNVMDLPLDKIRSLKQVRFKFRYIDELAESLIEEGQQSPIIVSPVNENGIYIIQKGERRFRAAQKAGLPTIRAIIGETPKDNLDSVAGQLIENIQREDLEPMELAQALKLFADEGWTHERIANRLSKSRVYVTRHLALIDMPKPLEDLYNDDIVTDAQTLNALNTLHKEDPATALAMCQRARDDGSITRSQVSDALREVKEAKRLEKERQEESARLLAEAEASAAAGEDLSGTHENNSDATETADPQEQGESPAAVKSRDAAKGEGAAAPSKKPASNNSSEKLIVTGDQELVIEVSVIMENGDVEPGTLMLEAVSPAPSFAWIFLTNKQEEHCVHTTRVAITKVTAR